MRPVDALVRIPLARQERVLGADDLGLEARRQRRVILNVVLRQGAEGTRMRRLETKNKNGKQRWRVDEKTYVREAGDAQVAAQRRLSQVDMLCE